MYRFSDINALLGGLGDPGTAGTADTANGPDTPQTSLLTPTAFMRASSPASPLASLQAASLARDEEPDAPGALAGASPDILAGASPDILAGTGRMSVRDFMSLQQQRKAAEQKTLSDVFEDATQSLQQARVGPSSAEQDFALAKVLGSPTRTGTFGETAALFGGAMQANAAATRTAEEARRAALMQMKEDLANKQAALGEKYDTAANQYGARLQIGEDAAAAKVAAANAKQAGVGQLYDENLTGDDLYAALNPADKAQVDAIREGRVLAPTTGSRAKEGQRLLEITNRVDPTFDASVAKARFKTNLDYSPGGAVGKNIASFNTAIDHLDSLDKAATALDNWGGWLTYGNYVKNALSQAHGDPQVNNFNLARNAVKAELTRAFRGSSGSLSEVKDWEATLNAANSPEALHDAVKKATELLAGRAGELVDPYNRTMGQDRTFLSWMSPRSRAIFMRLNPDYQLSEADNQYLANPTPGAPKPAPVTPEKPAATSAPAPATPAHVTAIDAILNEMKRRAATAQPGAK